MKINRKPSLNLLYLFFCLSFLTSCIGRITYDVSSKDKKAVPQDFMEDNSVLLVQLDGKKRVDKFYRNQGEKLYKGSIDYLVLGSLPKSKEERVEEAREKLRKLKVLGYLKEYYKPDFIGKYADKNKYRYFLGHYRTTRYELEYKRNVTTMDTSREGYRKTAKTNYFFYLLDRKTDKIYNNPISSPMNTSLFKGYIQALEEARLRNI